MQEAATGVYRHLKRLFLLSNSVEDLQTYIDMLDDMEQSKDIKGLREALSPYILRINGYGQRSEFIVWGCFGLAP